MLRARFLLLLAALCSAPVRADYCDTNDGHIDQAVAWGVAGQVPAIGPTGSIFVDGGSQGRVPAYYQWLYWVDENFDSEVALISPPGVPFPDNTSAFSYCSIAMSLPINNLLLAQTDDGSCNQTFGAECRHAMTDAAGSAARMAVDENVSGQPLCVFIGLAVNSTFANAPECRARNPSAVGLGMVPGVFTPGAYCNRTNTTSSTLFPGYRVATNVGYEDADITLNPYYQGDSNAGYERRYRTVFPQMLVAIPSVNDVRPSQIQTVVQVYDAFMGCPRAVNHTANAAVPSPLPAGNAAVALGRSAATNGLLGALVSVGLALLL